MLNPKHLLRLGIQSVQSWSNDYAPSMGAAISYYTVFSLAPLLVIVIAVAGGVFGREAVMGEITGQISGMVGPQGAQMVERLVAQHSDTERGLVAGLASFVLLLVGATTVFAELQNALDRIWKVPEANKPAGIVGILRARLLSFGLILAVAFLLMVSLLVSALLASVGTWAGGLVPGWEALLQGLNLLVSLVFLSALFATIFKLMPSAPVRWSDVWVGAIVTALLFEVGKLLIGLYIGKSRVNESFEAAGALVILLVWVYYAAQIFLLGAEFTKAYADAHGSLSGPRKAPQENPTRD
ncbi:YihY/virulence factor BrkB family protein [Ramlibacter sp.]|uniref:YihY/virulence factor BrkB family protein n=1 Tax=Ramlibacter sp. TaxID=1917967 RepID=UPI002FCB3AC6